MATVPPPLARICTTRCAPGCCSGCSSSAPRSIASLSRLDEATARAQIGAVLEHLGNFLATGDLRLHRAFLQTFLAMRAAESQSPASVLAALVAIGDTAAQVAQEEGARRPEGVELMLLLTRVTASTARAQRSGRRGAGEPAPQLA